MYDCICLDCTNSIYDHLKQPFPTLLTIALYIFLRELFLFSWKIGHTKAMNFCKVIGIGWMCDWLFDNALWTPLGNEGIFGKMWIPICNSKLNPLRPDV